MPYSPENNPCIPGDPYSYDLKWMVDNITRIKKALDILEESYSTPTVIDAAVDMINRNKIYVYVGNEAGFSHNHWYYCDPATDLWTDGGSYGSLDIDLSLDALSNNAIANSAVTTALAGKQNTISFPLSVGNGGTGKTATPSLLVDLESTSATSPYNASPRPGITGTLPVNHGGTGATSIASAAHAFINGLTSEASPADTYNIPVDSGSVARKSSISDIKAAMQLSTDVKISSSTANDDDPKTYTIPNGGRALFVVCGSAAARSGCFIVGATSLGTVTTQAVSQGTAVSYTSSTNSFTLTITGGSSAVMVITLQGTPITEA